MKKSLTPTSVREKTNFLSLPAELRNTIYSLALAEDKLVRVRMREYRPPGTGWPRVRLSAEPVDAFREPGLLTTTKTIRNEASTIYYKSHDFELAVSVLDMKAAADWLRTITQRCGSDPFKHFTFYVTDDSLPYADLELIRPLVWLLAETKLVFTPRPVDATLQAEQELRQQCGLARFGSLFEFAEDHCESLQAVLESAVQIGVQASNDIAYGEQLEEKIDTWMRDEIMS